MTEQGWNVRRRIARAWRLRQQWEPYEAAAECLKKTDGGVPMKRHLEHLRSEEASARIEVQEMLDAAELTPRQYTVLHLHYLEYLSWSNIALRLHIERRYALQIHTQAIERMAAQEALRNMRRSV